MVEKQKIKISNSMKGKHNSPKTEFKKGIKGYWYGKTRNEETKEKIRQKVLETYTEGRIPPMKDKSLTKEHKNKISVARKGCFPNSGSFGYSREYKGELHWNWKGGVTSLKNRIKDGILYNDWRKQIFEKDNYTCQNCNNHSKKGKSVYLHPHHIKSYNLIVQEFLEIYNQFSLIEDRETLVRLAMTYEPFWDTNNGITLCKKCHRKFHKLFGNKNNKKQMVKFLN